MSSETILVVDDDPKIRRLLRRNLEAEGFGIVEAEDRASALAALGARPISLVTLDLKLGADNGLDVAKSIRNSSNIPIIMVTGRNDVIDRVVGLEIGADDYVTKPFHLREVIARIRSVLRRAQASPDPGKDKPEPRAAAARYSFDGMTADPSRIELLDRTGAPVELTAGDFRLLEVFLDSPNRVLSRDAIMDRLHGQEWSPYDRTIDNQVARLRKKIEVDPASPRLIKTVRGIGYTFASKVSHE